MFICVRTKFARAMISRRRVFSCALVLGRTRRSERCVDASIHKQKTIRDKDANRHMPLLAFLHADQSPRIAMTSSPHDIVLDLSARLACTPPIVHVPHSIRQLCGSITPADAHRHPPLPDCSQLLRYRFFARSVGCGHSREFRVGIWAAMVSASRNSAWARG